MDELAVGLNEAARLLGVSRRTVENYLRVKLLRGRKLGGRTVILTRDLQAFVRRDQPSASPPKRTKTDPAEEIPT